MPIIPTVIAVHVVAATVPEAEAHWYDTGRWAAWVDGFDHLVAVAGPWPALGATVTWQSGPAGRGRVIEQVIDHEPLTGQTVAVLDDSISGQQSIAFAPDATGAQVTLSLAYRITRRSPITAVIDRLFVRRAMTLSLRQTVTRFAVSLESAHPPQP